MSYSGKHDCCLREQRIALETAAKSFADIYDSIERLLRNMKNAQDCFEEAENEIKMNEEKFAQYIANSKIISDTTKDNFKECIEKYDTLIIDFYADWCGPCKMVARDIFPQKIAGDYFNREFVNIKIDMEKANKWIANGAQPTDTVKVLLKKSGITE